MQDLLTKGVPKRLLGKSSLQERCNVYLLAKEAVQVFEGLHKPLAKRGVFDSLDSLVGAKMMRPW